MGGFGPAVHATDAEAATFAQRLMQTQQNQMNDQIVSQPASAMSEIEARVAALHGRLLGLLHRNEAAADRAFGCEPKPADMDLIDPKKPYPDSPAVASRLMAILDNIDGAIIALTYQAERIERFV